MDACIPPGRKKNIWTDGQHRWSQGFLGTGAAPCPNLKVGPAAYGNLKLAGRHDDLRLPVKGTLAASLLDLGRQGLRHPQRLHEGRGRLDARAHLGVVLHEGCEVDKKGGGKRGGGGVGFSDALWRGCTHPSTGEARS